MMLKVRVEKLYLDNFQEQCKFPKGCNKAKKKAIETAAQKYAIKVTFETLISEFDDSCASEIWKVLQSTHIKRRSGAELTTEQIDKVISSQQSWNKSSGHAFEEFLPSYFNKSLEPYNIKICLQRDISYLLNSGQLNNKDKDIIVIKSWLEQSVFDLYLVFSVSEKNYIFGTVQAKTSIRDRVTRDREPAIQAMEKFFWAIALVLDGDFLRLPKFKSMVNGGTDNYPTNGWHGMYVFSNTEVSDRIYSEEQFLKHCVDAKNSWEAERQWFDHSWYPDKGKL